MPGEGGKGSVYLEKRTVYANDRSRRETRLVCVEAWMFEWVSEGMGMDEL